VRRVLPLLAAAVLVAIVVIGLTQAGGDSGSGAAAEAEPFDLDRALASLEGAPPPLAALHDQANEILDGGTPALRKRLRELRGHPVVLNKWASWCGPCRHEFPFFQRVSTEQGKRVAFVGLNSGDSRSAAQEFLGEFPLTYPSYEDPDEKIARAVGAPANYPITVFLDENGEQAFIRQGGYASEAKLNRDIDRYLG
jgi:thiol-disulfide isomerase/thioredoxin